jgi:two-component system, OmpR family, heavy metal sensor histidine kinase CusS
MKFNSLKFEISILYTAILGLILIVFSGVLYFISNAFFQQIDQELKIKAQAVDVTIRSYLNALGESHDNMAQAVGKTMAMKNENFLQYKTWKISQKWMKQAHSLNLDKDYLNIISRDAKEVFSSANLDKDLSVLMMEDIQFPRRGRVTYRTLNVRNINIRVINYLFADNAVGRYLIQVGVPQDPLLEHLRHWLYSISLIVPLILLMTNFVGRILANRILQPVYEITDMAKRITHQDLSARITTKHFGREMESLIDSFNEMIAGLENSFNHIEQFSYHVAHELKTPLTIILGEANLLLRKDRSIPEYRKALGIIVEESQRLLKTFDDLLLLTKLGYKQEIFKFEHFDFMEFLSEIVEQNRMLAADKRITIRMDSKNITTPLMINGDSLHLRRLFFNIIDNAIKFSAPGGCVDLRVEHSHGKIISLISDTGPGIAPENLEKILEKLNNADKNIPGSGLGLCIAYTIARLHQGEIQVESLLGQGTSFRVILPSLN